MSFQDRQYYKEPPNNYGGGNFASKIGIGMPPLTPMVKILLIINFAVFFLQIITEKRIDGGIDTYLAADSTTIWQFWRLITFQFLHGNLWHIALNMLGLYFLGTTLERSWGGKKLLKFYLTCGAVGGLIYLLLSGPISWLPAGRLVGASGGVLGIIVACAILFPHFKLIIVIFPVPIRFATILFTVVFVLNVINRGSNAGGDLCHLGGMATGFIWVMGRGYFNDIAAQAKRKNAVRTVQEKQAMQVEIDRILDKVHSHGMQNLTKREKNTLKKATEEQRKGKF
ncbi:MAG: rhomboid family intramembrane serine protease [Phycisphaerae bacterium]|nr:rhomboid family intramembrane serine protease [Phycisphaerae bacterium]